MHLAKTFIISRHRILHAEILLFLDLPSVSSSLSHPAVRESDLGVLTVALCTYGCDHPLQGPDSLSIVIEMSVVKNLLLVRVQSVVGFARKSSFHGFRCVVCWAGHSVVVTSARLHCRCIPFLAASIILVYWSQCRKFSSHARSPLSLHSSPSGRFRRSSCLVELVVPQVFLSCHRGSKDQEPVYEWRPAYCKSQSLEAQLPSVSQPLLTSTDARCAVEDAGGQSGSSPRVFNRHASKASPWLTFWASRWSRFSPPLPFCLPLFPSLPRRQHQADLHGHIATSHTARCTLLCMLPSGVLIACSYGCCSFPSLTVLHNAEADLCVCTLQRTWEQAVQATALEAVGMSKPWVLSLFSWDCGVCYKPCLNEYIGKNESDLDCCTAPHFPTPFKSYFFVIKLGPYSPACFFERIMGFVFYLGSLKYVVKHTPSSTTSLQISVGWGGWQIAL